jgi:alkanesulfonate monooxygenase SsuD/methylene tetrahydromethanopterin reductase-like flavin-dependent oxidoreductase (luciferase family)
VINTAIWNPEFLAREALTLEQLSGGRLELGLGAGNAKSESETVGAAWQGAHARVAQMRETLLTVRRRLEAADPNPGPGCVLAGAMSRTGLDVAARLDEDPDDLGPTAFAESPCALFAKTAADAAAEIERRRERWGFTSMTTFEGSAAALSAVMREMR